MAITAVNKTANLGEADATSFTTASVAYTANRLYLASVVSHLGTAPTHEVTGTVTAWTLVATVTFNTIATPNKRISVFRCMPSTSPTETVALTQSGGTMSNCHWSIDEFDGVETAGTNGSGAIGQALTGNADSGTSLTVALAAFAAGSAAFGAFAHAANEATTPGASFTELSDTPGTETPTTSFETEWRLADADPSASWTTSSTNGGVGIEIKELAAGGGALAWEIGWVA